MALLVLLGCLSAPGHLAPPLDTASGAASAAGTATASMWRQLERASVPGHLAPPLDTRLNTASGAAAAARNATAPMWRHLERACATGDCGRHSNTSSTVANSTDCKNRMLAYEFGLSLVPAKAPLQSVFDALELQTCGVTPPPATQRTAPTLEVPLSSAVFYVDFSGGSDTTGDGSGKKPFKTVAHAVVVSRAHGPAPTVVLKQGVHYLAATVDLTPADSGLTIMAASGEEVWVSGGVVLNGLAWQKWAANPTPGHNIWVTDVPSDVAEIKGLNTLDEYRRVTRARAPNGDPELCTDCWFGGIDSWHHDTACVGKAKTVYKDLRDCDAKGLLPDGGPCKNDSAMWDTYNTYSNGHGGCCGAWSGDWSPFGPMGNYFCGNASAGGWVGFDDPRGSDRAQGLSAQLPVGFDYDGKTFPIMQTLGAAAGAIVHAWRAQGWFVNMFEVAAHDKGAQTVTFAKQSNGLVKGGWQGGRGWQVGDPGKINDTSGYLTGGSWMIENALELLDAPNEYYHDRAAGKLYMWPNGTGTSAPADTLVAVQLDTLINMNASKAAPITGVRIAGINFRDAADVTMKPWGVPSGGDWSLFRGGAIFYEGTEACQIDHCTFERLDGNAIMVSGWNRNTSITDNEFSWLGASAIAGWGYTDENDGMAGLQPRFTYILRNIAREIGIIEKQSSFWFQAKTCQSVVEANLIFNGPRAGINLNDGFGGGTNITSNLIFNECRETGDHGPINSWDRTAYISDVFDGTPSYTAQMNNVENNMIIANYGSSQGFDTDDGSSWYNIHHNYFFQADATKMDYGGHDMAFTDNVIWVRDSDGQNCFNQGAYLPGHGLEYARNKCILPYSKTVGHVSGCDCAATLNAAPNASVGTFPHSPATICGVDLHDNAYFGIEMNLTIDCGKPTSFQEWTANGNDKRSNEFALPTDDQLLFFARTALGMPTPGPAPAPPRPLPPAPIPHWPNTCEGRCGKGGHCCIGLVSGCSQPSCPMGCVIARNTGTLAGCLADCKQAEGKCTYKSGNATFNQCNACPNTDGCQACDTHGACEDGCHYGFPAGF